MKNQVKNLLRAGVLSLAAVFAFAFTTPTGELQPKYQRINNVWTEVSNLNYDCNTNIQEVCTYASPDTSTPLEMGRFSL